MKPEDENDRRPELDQDPDPGIGSDRGAAAAEARAVPADVQDYIGRQLRAVYEDVVKQPIPDRFLALMRQLEEQHPED